MTVIIAIIFIITISITVRNVYEAPTNIETGITLRFKDIWRILFTNKELLAYIGILVTFFLSIQILGNVAIYYFGYVAVFKAFFFLFFLIYYMDIFVFFLFTYIY